jgi:uncharacterized cupredoxin-like copper-binding protein
VTQHRPVRRAVVGVACVVALVALAAGCGDDGGGGDDEAGLSAGATATTAGGPRTVPVVMTDNAFSPARVEVAAGETVTFAFRNEGSVTHDAVVGDAEAQAEHEDEMRAAEAGAGDHTTDGTDAMEGMGHGDEAGGDEAGGAAGEEAAITVEPGATGELTHTFAGGEGLLVGCHEPGHYDAGMRIDVAVSPA